MEEERRGPRVQPPVWLWRAGCRGHGENGPRMEDGAGAVPLCRWIHPGQSVRHISINDINVGYSINFAYNMNTLIYYVSKLP